ncbi:MAG: hypothetical protein RL338_611, partial [Chloroflexota bacterium]
MREAGRRLPEVPKREAARTVAVAGRGGRIRAILSREP